MKRKLLFGMIAIAITPLLSSRAAAQGFMEIEGTVIATEETQAAVFVIERVFGLPSADRLVAQDSLQVACPLGDRRDWRALFTAGDRLPLTLTVERKASLGWLVFGGRGERVTLSVPRDGWPIRCTCAGKPSQDVVFLHGVFVAPGSAPTGTITCEGEDSGFFKRLLPFWRGGRAKLTGLRIRCSFTPAELKNATSIVPPSGDLQGAEANAVTNGSSPSRSPKAHALRQVRRDRSR